MSKLLKWTGVALAVLFVSIQLVRPAKTNPVVDGAQTIEAHVRVAPEVAQIFERACQDCHSHETQWPWYSQVAPVSWFVIDHVDHGRKHLNFSEWARYDQQKADDMLESICEWVEDGRMPLSSYTLIHRDARLTPEDREAICHWVSAERRRLASVKK